MNVNSNNRVTNINTFVSSVLRSKDLNWPKILESVQSPFKDDYSLISKAVATYPDAPWQDAWSKGQIGSKLWLINELGKIQHTFSCVYIIGGWLGVLSWLLFRDSIISVNKIRSFDIDPSCHVVADRLNIDNKIDNWKFKAITADAMEMKYSSTGHYDIVMQRFDGTAIGPLPEKPDCIINTSCDHFENLDKWVAGLPKNSLIVLQNTDMKHDDTHVNIVNSIEDFKTQAKLGTVLFSGTLSLENYKRFMLIGHR